MLPITREMAPERAGGGGGLSRPFVLAVVLLILFLTLQADWNAANSRREGRRGSALYSSGAAGDGVGGVGSEAYPPLRRAQVANPKPVPVPVPAPSP